MTKEVSSSLCGLGPWRPCWLQRFNSTRGFLVVYGLLGTIQAMSYIYFVATLTTMEKRFKISSKTTGLMMSGNEISQVLLSLILSYYGGQRNRPLWIGWGVAFSAASCYILALPHLLYGPGEEALALTLEYSHPQSSNSSIITKEQASLCSRGEDSASKCNGGDGGEFSNIPALLVFLSQFVLGIGTTLYYALGQTYIDDNTKKSKTPLLLSLTMSLRTIGPAFGFLIGYGCLRLYISPTLTPIITYKDPRWLGAWWLGWLIFGTAMVVFSVLVAMFPKKLPISKSKVDVINNGDIVTLETAKQTEKAIEFVKDLANEKLVSESDKEDLPTLKEFPVALSRLLGNRILIANILSGVFYIMGGSAYITYITKYLEVQFHHSAADASFVVGPTTILSMTAGFIISGIVISKFKPRPTYLLGWNVIVGTCFILGQISFVFLSCKDSNMVGFRRGNEELNLVNGCNRDCGCGSLKFNPVCLEHAQVTFYTACHAGCSQANYSQTPIVYTNCSCIPDNIMPTLPRKDEIFLKRGACKSSCFYNFAIFIGITLVMHTLGSSGRIGNVLVNYRAVDSVDKSFAQGLGLLMVSLFAFIPGPILFGALIDSTCLVWDETCGNKGNCWLYDKDRMGLLLNMTSAGFTLIGVIFDAIVCYLGRDLKLYEDDDEDINKSSIALPTTNDIKQVPSEKLQNS